MLLVLALVCLATVVSSIENVSEVITGYGYPLEVHETTTEDGYILQLLRIPHGKNASRSTGAGKKAVLLQHGLGSCCADWFLNSPYQSIGFILADLGYDVWVGNNRGNGYSMRHVYYNPTQPEFWYFTWDDMAQYDFPTEINYVLNVTGQSTLSYVGISQGTCQAFAAFSENSNIAKKVNLFIALAPVAYLDHQGSMLITLLANLDLADILELLGEREFYLPDAIHNLLPSLCKVAPQSCEYGMSLLLGPSVYLNQSRLGFYAEYEIVPTSIWNMIHWSQGVGSGKYRHMDWGTQENIKRYGQPTPPLYTLGSIPKDLNIALFTGGNDFLAEAGDVQRLVSELPSKPVLIYNQPNYSHIDYVISENAWQADYPTFISLLQKYNN